MHLCSSYIIRDFDYGNSHRKENSFQRNALSRATGTDTDSFAFSNGGVPSVLISLPAKIHAHTVEMVAKEDVANVIKLILRNAFKIKPE